MSTLVGKRVLDRGNSQCKGSGVGPELLGGRCGCRVVDAEESERKQGQEAGRPPGGMCGAL